MLTFLAYLLLRGVLSLCESRQATFRQFLHLLFEGLTCLVLLLAELIFVNSVPKKGQVLLCLIKAYLIFVIVCASLYIVMR